MLGPGSSGSSSSSGTMGLTVRDTFFHMNFIEFILQTISLKLCSYTLKYIFCKHCIFQLVYFTFSLGVRWPGLFCYKNVSVTVLKNPGQSCVADDAGYAVVQGGKLRCYLSCSNCAHFSSVCCGVFWLIIECQTIFF